MKNTLFTFMILIGFFAQAQSNFTIKTINNASIKDSPVNSSCYTEFAVPIDEGLGLSDQAIT